jgi:hypothetical protein
MALVAARALNSGWPPQCFEIFAAILFKLAARDSRGGKTPTYQPTDDRWIGTVQESFCVFEV